MASVEKFMLVFRRKGKIVGKQRNFLSYNDAQRAYRDMDRIIPLDVSVKIESQTKSKPKSKMNKGGVVRSKLKVKSRGTK
tara:strand:- start:59 stop:298 length:240 start_codon:yes stop_codon:yes gene_type:complete